MANLQRQLKFGEQFEQIAMQRVKAVGLEEFRKAVWALFTELVYTTPQFTGRAAANWNIGIGAPDLSVDHSLGEQMEIVDNKTKGGAHAAISPKRVGDDKWASVALDRNKYKLRQITQWGQEIFISNAVTGDEDTSLKTGGNPEASNKYYLAALQSPSYWAQRLRIANQPYETVSQVLLMESWRARLNDRLVGMEFFQ